MLLQVSNLEQALLQIQQHPDKTASWADALTHSVLADDPASQQALLQMMQQQSRCRIEPIAGMAERLAELGQIDHLNALAQQANPIWAALCQMALAQYFYLTEYDLDRSHALYDSILRNFPFNNPLSNLSLTEVHNLKTRLFHRVLAPLVGIEPLCFTDAVPARTVNERMPALPQTDLLVLAACDDVYARLYAAQFLTAITQALPQATILIHVMNPTAEGWAAYDTLRQQYPHVVFSEEDVEPNIPYYAARRFTLAEELRQQRWRGDILVLDIDEVATPALADVVATVRSAPVALWQTKVFDRAISGLYEGVVFLRADSAITDQFLATARSYLEHKRRLKQEFWGWDGFALYHALCKLGQQRSVAVDLRTLYPTLFAEIVPQIIRHKKAGQDSHLLSPTMQTLFRRLLQQRFDPSITPEPFQWFLHNP